MGGDICVELQQVSDLLPSFGCLLGLLSLRSLYGSQVLGTERGFLIIYANQLDVISTWSKMSRRQGFKIVFLGTIAMHARGFSVGLPGDWLQVWRSAASL